MSATERYLLDYKKRSQRIGKPLKTTEKISSYTPLHPDLFCLKEVTNTWGITFYCCTYTFAFQHYFYPSFINAIKSGDEKQMRSILQEVAPRIYVFDMFTEEFCEYVMFSVVLRITLIEI